MRFRQEGDIPLLVDLTGVLRILSACAQRIRPTNNIGKTLSGARRGFMGFFRPLGIIACLLATYVGTSPNKAICAQISPYVICEYNQFPEDNREVCSLSSDLDPNKDPVQFAKIIASLIRKDPPAYYRLNVPQYVSILHSIAEQNRSLLLRAGGDAESKQAMGEVLSLYERELKETSARAKVSLSWTIYFAGELKQASQLLERGYVKSHYADMLRERMQRSQYVPALLGRHKILPILTEAETGISKFVDVMGDRVMFVKDSDDRDWFDGSIGTGSDSFFHDLSTHIGGQDERLLRLGLSDESIEHLQKLLEAILVGRPNLSEDDRIRVDMILFILDHESFDSLFSFLHKIAAEHKTCREAFVEINKGTVANRLHKPHDLSEDIPVHLRPINDEEGEAFLSKGIDVLQKLVDIAKAAIPCGQLLLPEDSRYSVKQQLFNIRTWGPSVSRLFRLRSICRRGVLSRSRNSAGATVTASADATARA